VLRAQPACHMPEAQQSHSPALFAAAQDRR